MLSPILKLTRLTIFLWPQLIESLRAYSKSPYYHNYKTITAMPMYKIRYNFNLHVLIRNSISDFWFHFHFSNFNLNQKFHRKFHRNSWSWLLLWFYWTTKSSKAKFPKWTIEMSNYITRHNPKLRPDLWCVHKQ